MQEVCILLTVYFFLIIGLKNILTSYQLHIIFSYFLGIFSKQVEQFHWHHNLYLSNISSLKCNMIPNVSCYLYLESYYTRVKLLLLLGFSHRKVIQQWESFLRCDSYVIISTEL